MKKRMVGLLLGAMILSCVACGNADKTPESAPSVPQTQEQVPVPESTETSETQGGDFMEGEAGFSEEMTGLRDAVMQELQDDYWPNMQIPAEMLESVYGLNSDMYVDFMGEMPMMSTQVDSLLIVKAAEGQVEAVESALQAYRDNMINNSLQYPMNLGKVQGSMVERVGDYVILSVLGGDVLDAADAGNEEIIKQCQEHNQRAINAIKAQLGM